MCLLIYHPATTRFTQDDIADFYHHNSDGVGIMFVEASNVIVEKMLPKNAEDAWQFYKRHAQGRDCAMHFRMKTHGHIDMENCHPYAIPNTDCWLMHNGVLAIGNDKDRTKSDTWHYAREYLAPILANNPDIIFNEAFQDMLGTHIGRGNRFIIMSPRGHVIINQHHGVDHKGAWLSNTYAWSAPIWGAPTAHHQNFDLQEDQVLEYFFDVLAENGLWVAYERANVSTVLAAINFVGVNAFYEFCNCISDMSLDDAAVLQFVRDPRTITTLLDSSNQKECAYDNYI